jgi:hypothetical protein
MLDPAIESRLIAFKEVESSERWAAKSSRMVAGLLREVADLFCECGDADGNGRADEVTPTEVWPRSFFPSFGLLSAAYSFSKTNSIKEHKGESVRLPHVWR